MHLRRLVRVGVNPRNPVQYLACCGVFEIVARFDEGATGRWLVNNTTEFVLESQFEEASLLDCLAGSLADWSCWSSEYSETGETIRLNVVFSLMGESITLGLDWWYETLDGQRKIKKSAWKMYAGQQTVNGITSEMVKKAGELAAGAPPETLTNLISLKTGMKGRFGLDPRSSRNALDAGFSANDLNLSVETYPFAETLAVIGAQLFFPHRTRPSGGNESTRGWIEKGAFRYGVWTIALPIMLARMAACCAGFEDEGSIFALHSARASRDKYSNLSMASHITLRR